MRSGKAYRREAQEDGVQTIEAMLSEARAAGATEIRLRLGQACEMVTAGARRYTGRIYDGERMEETAAQLCGQARYAAGRAMADGAVILPDGSRAGIAGHMVMDEKGEKTVGRITSICIRIAQRREGAGKKLYPYLLDEKKQPCRVLIIGAPGSGKTTILRDVIEYLGQTVGLHVCVSDERRELFAGDGYPHGVDVLSGMKREEAMMQLLRTMSPDMIAADEIGTEADTRAALECVRCGVGVLMTAHARSMEDIRKRPMLRRAYESRAFDRYIHTDYRFDLFEVWDEEGNRVC